MGGLRARAISKDKGNRLKTMNVAGSEAVAGEMT